MKEVLILAGGKGTRLRERLGDMPKPLIDLAGTPLLERQIVFLRKYGYKNIFILVNYQAQYIEKFCKQKKFLDLNICIIDDGEPLGTAGATLNIIDRLQDQVLIVYGDTVFDIDLNRLELFHRQDPDVAATLFLHPNDHPTDSDLVEIDEYGYVTQFHSYPHCEDALLPNLVNAALYIVNTSHFKQFKNFPKPSDFAKDLFPFMLDSGKKFLGYSSPEYIKDIGTPERLDRAEEAIKIGRVERSNLNYPQKAVFIDRDGTLNEEIGQYVTTPDLLKIYNGVGSSLKRLHDSEWRTILVSNQPIVARGECSFKELRKINAKLEKEIAKSKAFFDKIYICPHHPDDGFEGEVKALKIICTCRKPAPGMFLNAKKELNIDLSLSWHIGDSSADLGAAINAGITSITVETGNGGLDDKYSFQPEFSVPNFSDAVDFILTTYPKITRNLHSIIESISTSKVWFIGGLSRSGKSTIANIIKRELNINDISCHVLSLDRWLLDEDKRGDGVWERYETSAIIGLIKQITSINNVEGVLLNLPNYSRVNRKRHIAMQSIKVSSKDIIIWEGVIANAIANDLGLNQFSIYVEANESVRKSRMSREYLRRGLTENQINTIVTQRASDENIWIESQKRLAKKVLQF